MSRAAGVNPRLVLPTAPDKYDAGDQREVRRLIQQALVRLTPYNAIDGVPDALSALESLTGAADEVPYFTSASAMALASLTPYARTIIACANAAAARTVLGLGALAVLGGVDETLISLSDLTTDNVTSTAHGFAPKSPADATKFLNGAATPAYALVKGSDLSLADVTTNDVSITAHGFAPKAPNNTSKFLRGDATWATVGAGSSPAVLTDTTDLAAWFSADNPANTVGANTGIITVFADLSGNGRTFTPGTGTIIKQYAQLAGSPVAFFASPMTALAGITVPLKGAMTFFAVLKVTATSNSQVFFYPSGTPAQPSDMYGYWHQATGKWQVDGSLTPFAGVAGTWHTLVIHFYNTSGVMHFQLRQDGGLTLGDTASTNGSNPVPGSSGSPTNFGLNLFLDIVSGNSFRSQIAEWGVYAVSKAGSEATLESYLRAKYSTW